MYTYKAGYMGKPEITFEAESLYAARQKAEAHYKPSKRNAGLLWVVRADVPISTASLG